jgi:ElaB/YqjD/DUF883 family membrane-anchored ribosome-binding protein
MNTPSTREPLAYPFPDADDRPDRAEDSIAAGVVSRVAEAAATTRDHLADAALHAEARADAFRETAAGYIQCYPFRSVLVSAALGFLLGLLAARLPR